MDEFDAILNLESEWEEEGRKDGHEEGRKQGIKQGRDLGLEKGHELGHELGYYAGCADAWIRLYLKQAAGGDEQTEHEEGKVQDDESPARGQAAEEAEAGAESKRSVKGKISERTYKNLQALVELVHSFPVDDLTDERVTDRIDKIRAKFKVVVSQLGMVPEMQAEKFSF